MLSELEVPRLLAGIAKAPAPRTVGYLGNVPLPGLGGRFGPNPDAFGGEGLGGQYGFCDRKSKIAVGFIRSELAVIDVLHLALTDAVYDCARALGHKVYTPRKLPFPNRLGYNLVGNYMRKRVAVPDPSAR
jgi:CubicO group peptidase (beta-lactamase class C family)